MRELTDHKVNPANDVLTVAVTDEPGSGGANHMYEVSGYKGKSGANSVLLGGGLDPHGAYDHREVAGVEVLPCAPTYTEQQIADACMAAEVPDSKCESVLLALRAQRSS